jgi:hypothetical protein
MTDDPIYFGPEHDALCTRADEIRATRLDAITEIERERYIADIVRLDARDTPADLRKKHPVYLRDLAAGAYDRAAARIANAELDRRFQARLDAEASHAHFRVQLHALRASAPERVNAKRMDTEAEAIARMKRALERPN